MRVLFNTILLIVTISLAGLLAGCGLPVEKVPLAEPLNQPEDARPSPIAFNKIRFAVPTGTPTIANAPTSFWEWFWSGCDGPYGLTSQGSLRGRGFPSDSSREIFSSTMASLGYDVAGDPGRLFDEVEDLQRAFYGVGGRVVDIKINKCPKTGWFGSIPRGNSGEGSVTIEWTVFDLLHRKNAYKTTTKGYGRVRTPNFEGVQLLYEDALAAAMHNLGADKNFHDLIFYGTQPKNQPDTVFDPYEEPLGKYNPNEEVILRTNAISKTPIKNRMEDATDSVVLIQTAGHGSGFFITPQGHILTNAHVVGHATRTRVVTSKKKEKLIAEVLRLDWKRDVALLKLEKIPDDLKIKPLPVRTAKPKIGEDVYAVGAPAYTRLQDTVTKGIVSAHRYNREKKQWEMQADVETHGGNSGGPLIDENGNIVGMTVAGYIDGDGELSGLNLFIPIGDALEKLDIEINDGASTPTAFDASVMAPSKSLNVGPPVQLTP